MWSRKELKEKGKLRLNANYWKCVLVAIVFSLIGFTGILSAGSSGSRSGSDSTDIDYVGVFSADSTTGDEDILYSYSYPTDMKADFDRFSNVLNESELPVTELFSIVFIFAVVLGVIIAVLTYAVRILILSPLEIGCARFFRKNLNENASVKEICYTFDNSYKNGVKIMFFRGLYTFLWMLLFIIPGIVKAYEYCMIPYILSEHPSMDKQAAFALSKKMMTGNKWKAFVLDLSFIGWDILSALTLGILGVLYVNPYYQQTSAALYETLKSQTTPVTM